ncbi:MAG: hypothetical protein U9N35_03705 [Euryarchaeota archaeon]|nr:hypothetical protein [Euryarchaeota archaeon]
MRKNPEFTVQNPRVSMETLTKRIAALQSRIKRLEEERIKLSLKVVMTNRSIEDLKKKEKEIDAKTFGSLMSDYRMELHGYKKEEKKHMKDINSLKKELNLFEDYRPLLEKYKRIQDEIKNVIEEIRDLEKKLNYM